MGMQMGAGRKEHKNNERHHSASFAFALNKNTKRRSSGQFKETKEKIIVEYRKEVFRQTLEFFVVERRDNNSTRHKRWGCIRSQYSHYVREKCIYALRCKYERADYK